MIRKTIYFTAIISTAILFHACEGFFDHFSDKEKTSEIEYSLNQFDSIHVMDVFNVFLIQDGTNKIIIEGDESIIKEVKAKVAENTLELTNEYSVKWLKPKSNDVNIYLHFDTIAKIKCSQTSLIQTKTPLAGDEIGVIFEGKMVEGDLELGCNTFYYWNNHPCGGKLKLRGEVSSLKIWNFALMEVDAKELQTKGALVENYSQSHCWVKPDEKLEYSIHGGGNIYYSNKPDLVETSPSEGTGKLLKY